MKTFLKILKTIALTIIIGIIILLLIIKVKSLLNPGEVPSLFGYKAFIVLSGSMEDEINIGDIIISKEVPENELGINDIISFKSGKSITTHRIVLINDIDGTSWYTTKGDANNTNDMNPVEYSNIEGKLVYVIPKIGKLLLK